MHNSKTLIITALSLFALSANAEIVESGTCNSAKTCKYELDGEGNLRVYGTGEIGSAKFQAWRRSNLSAINSVVIERGITQIGNEAFDGLRSLKNISIPNTVTSIGSHAFNGVGLSEVIIPKSVTSIGTQAFDYTNLTDVTIKGKNVSMPNYTFSYGLNYHDVNFNVIEGSETEKRLKELYGSRSNAKFAAYIPPKRTSYTIEEAMEHIEKGDHNKITFTFK